VLDRKSCIGAAACVAVASKFWKLHTDGKVNIIGGKKNKDDSEQEIIVSTDKDFELVMEAARVCPVAVIHVFDLDKKEKLI
jgi:ferredoxin